MKKILEAKNAQLREKRNNRPAAGFAALLEGELERAQLTLSAQDVVNKLQDTAEDLAKMSVEQLLPLADEMKGEFGPEAANKFEEVVGTALENALQAVRDAREQVNNAVLLMQGKLSDEDVNTPVSDIASDTTDSDTADQELNLDDAGDEDVFAGAPAASGPAEEPLGRARKESIEYPVKKKSNTLGYSDSLLEAFVELAMVENFTSLDVEVVSDKFGVLEEEVLELYNSAERLVFETADKQKPNILNLNEVEQLNELLPLAALAARAVAGYGAKKLAGYAAKKIGTTALKKVGGAVLNKAAGTSLANKASANLSGADAPVDDDSTSAPTTTKPIAPKPTTTAKAAQSMRQLANNPKIKQLASKFKVQPKDLSDLAAEILTQSNDQDVNKPKLKEHKIIENISPVTKDDALTIVKERLKSIKNSKDLAVRETFSNDIKLTTPRMVISQLTAKYGDPQNWSVAQTNEGSYYVLSASIPEAEKAKGIENQITSLEEEIKTIREKHADIQVEYQLPQEIKIAELRTQFNEYQTGYRHQVAKWLSLNEASALISLAQAITPKGKRK
ncbi:MAG: hypothetical protein HC836_31835 [Richelia sp. RM2_1_2]|nr:hypothetical protein [Richelia sp. RM2_1_2]